MKTNDDIIIPMNQIIKTPTNCGGVKLVGPAFICDCDLDVLTANCTFVSEYLITTYEWDRVENVMHPELDPKCV